MYSLLIKKGTVIDGSGKPAFKADIACQGSEIVNIAPNISTQAHSVIDASDKIVAPGFIDIQNHSDSYWQLFDNPGLDSLVSQGFTTIMIGNCGASLAPLLSREALLALQKWHNLDGVNINWQSFAEFATHMSSQNFGCNVGSLVGYSTLRRGLVGDQVRMLENTELSILENNLLEALSSGAFGLSTGLAYSHEAVISEIELYALAQVVASKKGLFSVHLRSEGSAISESLEETLEIARRTGVNLKISHFKVRGQKNYIHLKHLLDQLETEVHKGTNVHFDAYPYDTTWQVLFSYLPKWAIEGGRGSWSRHLANPEQRNKILDYLTSSGTNFADLIVASTSNKLNVIGKRLSEIAKNLEISVEEAVLQIIEKGGSEVMVFDSNLNREAVAQLTSHPLGIVSTDGAGFSASQKNLYGSLSGQNRLVHPRCFGTTAKFISESLAAKHLTPEETIWKLTGLPAKKIGLSRRGQIQTGNFADLVIFDPAVIKDNASLLNPFQYSTGIECVLVNGQAAVADSNLTFNQAGHFLKAT